MRINKNGFSLVELLIALSILAVLLALIIPNFVEIHHNARVEILKQQANAIQKGIAAWMSSEDTTFDAAGAFTGTTSSTLTYIDQATWENSIIPYLDTNFLTTSELSFHTDNNGYITTKGCDDLTCEGSETIPETQTSPFGNVARAISTKAHIRIVWASSNTRRYESAPAVITFIPEE